LSSCHPLAYLLPLLLCVAGCAAYNVGVGSLYPSNVRTVGVRMFDSLSYRRYLGERLTEAVVKEIERRTPYKVVDADRADAVLTGRIIRDEKDVIVENRFDEPREGRLTMSVQVTWAGRQMTLPMPAMTSDVTAEEHFVPEVGHSIASTQQQVFQRLAQEIVNLMEIDPLVSVNGPPPGLVLPQVGKVGSDGLPGVSLPR
jgi:hypothetical protein